MPSSCSFFSTVPAIGFSLRFPPDCRGFLGRSVAAVQAGRPWRADRAVVARTGGAAYLRRNFGIKRRGGGGAGQPSPKRRERERFMVDRLAVRAAVALSALLVPATIAWPQDGSIAPNVAPNMAPIMAPIMQVPLIPHRAIYDL